MNQRGGDAKMKCRTNSMNGNFAELIEKKMKNVEDHKMMKL